MTNAPKWWSKIHHFKPEEFTCPCGCGKCDMEHRFIATLDALRTALDGPIIVSSGYRCYDHNLKVGTPNSAHTRGYAADILVADSRMRMEMLRIAPRWFPRMGIGASFVHLDTDPTLPQDVAWVY